MMASEQVTFDHMTFRRRTPRPWYLVSLTALFVLGWVAELCAQPPSAAGRARRTARAPIERHLIPPELVMAHQNSLGLSEEQRQKLVGEVQKMQSDIVPLQFQLSEATEQLARVLVGPRVDEETALARVEQVVQVESQIKKRHLQLLVRIKNILTADQQNQLAALRRDHR